MKICYLALNSTHTQRWMRYFADHGHEVHLISFTETPDYDRDKINLHVLKRYGPHIPTLSHLVNLAPAVSQVKRLLREIRADVLHAHYVRNDITLLGALSSFHPFVITVWGSDVLIDAQKSPLARWTAGYALRRADLVTSDARHIQPALEQLGTDLRKFSLIYFGTDTRKFSPDKRDEGLRHKLDITGSPAVISLRQLHNPLYDIESLIRAIPLVLREAPQAKFVIAGGRGNNPLELQLMELARTLGVWDSIRFAGWLTEDDLPGYLSSAEIYVSTALSDAGLSASTAEAMACGLPVVITDFGDNKEWVRDGVNGYTIPLKDPAALAARLIDLLKDEKSRKAFGENNRRLIAEKNNWEIEMARMGRLYEELAGKCKR